MADAKKNEVERIMGLAVQRRDELNTFIRLLMNQLQGRDFVQDEPRNPATHN
jgi:hypothetical protein